MHACLQAEIIKDPASYVELDPDMARTLLDQKQAVRAPPNPLKPSLPSPPPAHELLCLTQKGTPLDQKQAVRTLRFF